MIEWKQLERNGEIYKERWPFKNGIKAISPSSLTQPVSWLVYGYSEVPIKHIGMIANSQLEKAVSHYLLTRNWAGSMQLLKGMPPSTYDKAQLTLKKLAVIFKQPVKHQLHTIYFCDYKNRFIACETDIDFNSSIWEIKMSNIPDDEEKVKYLNVLFDLQLYIQKICSGKKVSLLHINSLKQFKEPKNYDINKLMELLLNIYDNKELLTPDEKMKMVKDFFNGGQEKLW